MLFGTISTFIFNERFIRKRSIIVANMVVIIGAVIQTALYTYWQMFVLRIISGIGDGLSTVAVPIIYSKTLPAHNYGALLVIPVADITIDITSAPWLCFTTLYLDTSFQWRFPVACGGCLTREYRGFEGTLSKESSEDRGTDRACCASDENVVDGRGHRENRCS